VDQCLFKQRLSDSDSALLNGPPALRGTRVIDTMTKAEVHLYV